jgi:uncharacterized protein DUF2800
MTKDLSGAGKDQLPAIGESETFGVPTTDQPSPKPEPNDTGKAVLRINQPTQKISNAVPVLAEPSTQPEESYLAGEARESTRKENLVGLTAPARPGDNDSRGGVKIDEKGVAHAEYPPSALGSFEKCPGYRNRNNKTFASERGDRIHKALEKDDFDILSEDEKPMAQTCKDYIDGVMAEQLPNLPVLDYREVRLPIDLGGNLTTFGTCDRLLVYEKDPQGLHHKAFLFDYKSGYREVTDAETNTQAWAYVVGAFQKFPNKYEPTIQIDEIDFTFLVPNRDEVLSHNFVRKDIPAMRLRLNTIIRKAMAIDWSKEVDPTLLNPQPELCEYCANQAICPALADKALAIGAKLTPGLPVPTHGLVSSKRPSDIPHLLRLAPLLETWAQNVRKEALRLQMEEGIDIPGFSRIERTLPRSATSVLGAWKAVKDKVPLEDFLAVCGQVSVPQLEDYFAEIAKRGDKGKARQDLENRLRAADVLKDQGTIYYLRENKK